MVFNSVFFMKNYGTPCIYIYIDISSVCVYISYQLLKLLHSGTVNNVKSHHITGIQLCPIISLPHCFVQSFYWNTYIQLYHWITDMSISINGVLEMISP